jgi:hypothetical protein
VSPLLRIALRALGLGALVAGGLAVALLALAAAILIGPLIFWLAGWAGKVGIAALVFLIDPSWFHGSAQARWPEPTLRNFVAVVLLALLAARPHSHAHKHGHKSRLVRG